MKNLLFVFLLVSTSVFSQDFEKNWNTVITYENEGKIKSADAIVQKIQKRAIHENNEVQLIKCFFYESKYMLVLDEDAQSKILANLDLRISKASIPTKAILNLVYAKCLNDYLKQNTYKLNRRTRIDSNSTGNFLIWNREDFQEQIKKRFASVLENPSVLKNTKLLAYEAVFDFMTLEKFKEQNLYSYLIQERIDFLATGNYLHQSNEEDSYTAIQVLFGNSQLFTRDSLESITSPEIREILQLYQQLEKDNPSPKNQFERVQFCSTTINIPYTDYLKALERLQKNTAVTDVLLQQQLLLQKALVFQNNVSEIPHPDHNIKALAILDSILSYKNKSNAYHTAINIRDNIIRKTLEINFKKYAYTKENLRASINYQNTDHVALSFYKINQGIVSEFEDYTKREAIVSNLAAKGKPYKTIAYKLEDPKDYLPHTTDVLLPELETGRYLLCLQTDENTTNTTDTEIITITDFVLLANTLDNNSHYQIVDRKSGKPLNGVTIKIGDARLVTDQEGKAIFHSTTYNNPRNYIEFTKGNDSLQVRGEYISSTETYEKENINNEIPAAVKFYLDRGIYRPGQTVYYKGIAFLQKNDIKTVCPTVLFKIIVEDSEGNEFKNFEITTNEFGSFSGEFTLPKNLMTGEFSMYAEKPDELKKYPINIKKKNENPFWDSADFEYSRISFQVEEYKRPKFEVLFEPVKEKFTVNQSATINGKAKAFDGSIITNAKVTYTVERQTYASYYTNYPSSTKIIRRGETQTDANGKFDISFIAEPDDQSDKKTLPIFNYIVKAAVTDINGETHQAETNLKAGFHSLILTVSVPDKMSTKDRKQITLNSTNLNNEFLGVAGEIRIYFLGPLVSGFKTADWVQPDLFSISSEDFSRLFPYEKDPGYDKKTTEQLLYSKKINTETAKTIPLDFISKYQSGQYKIVFTAKDESGISIENESNFELAQSADQYSTSELFTVEQLNENPKKDGFISLKIKSMIPELYLQTMAAYESGIFFDKGIVLKNHEALLKIPLANEHQNSITINFDGVFDNFVSNSSIAVELKQDEPTIEFAVESFRSRIQPGSPENWSFRLKSNQELQESEILASMYDSSLDQFRSSDWETLHFEKPYNWLGRRTSLGIANSSLYLKNMNRYSPYFQPTNEETRLMWFNFDFNNKITDTKEYKKQITKKAIKPRNSRLVYGIIADITGPLPGASVIVKGTVRGTQTDLDGYYEIEASDDEVLEISFIGLETVKVKADQSEINMILDSSGQELEEVVVTGYAVKTVRSNLTGSVTKVISTGNKSAIADFNEMLQGRAPGLYINMESGQSGSGQTVRIRGTHSITADASPLYIIDGIIVSENDFKKMNVNDIIDVNVLTDTASTSIYGSRGAGGVLVITTKKAVEELTKVKPRKNLSEMAFFFPQLRTDKDGRFSFNFTSPEALTEWKLRLFAHDKNATSGYLQRNVITQKEIMLNPNFPRFLREKDTITIQCKIANITAESKSGIAMLQLFDASSMETIDAKTLNTDNVRNFTVDAMGSTMVSWKITIPEGLQGIQYKIVAKAGDFSDGEENVIPVLTNNMLVTESIPLWVRENSKKEYTLENLKNNTSTTLRNQQLTLEYTSNPAWMAIQSLPYLMEYEHECAEQTFARFYANTLASEIINSNPKIAAVFESWKTKSKLDSRLEQNEELKSILLAETPWLADNQSEDEKKKNLALLFDLEKMKSSQDVIFDKLKQKQRPSGGFAWFDGSAENDYITRHILAGFGHLKKLNVKTFEQGKIASITKTGISFIDGKFLENHKRRINNIKDKSRLIWIYPYNELHYLYTRSFYLEQYPLSENIKNICQFYIETIKSKWLTYSLYEKGMAALTLERFGEKAVAVKIIESLKETSSNNVDSGMYWIANKPGWYWYQAPIETQALLIEAFSEISNDTKSVDAMKVWLLKNKQNKNWPTTKATTEAVYALLMKGSDWLSVKDNTTFHVGDDKILTRKLSEDEKEAETGYIKINWKAGEINKDMAVLTVNNQSKVPGYGGFYWQYFEDLDKIKDQSGGILTVSKELYLKKSTDKGEELRKITTENPLTIGDLVTVRLIIIAKEDMEYVHLKDMRASCFEPVNVLSEHQWKNGLGYYMATKDVATNFFFDSISKGTYVLEYDIRVNNKGDFSNGITTIQSMYAPEFAGHTKGIRVKIDK